MYVSSLCGMCKWKPGEGGGYPETADISHSDSHVGAKNSKSSEPLSHLSFYWCLLKNWWCMVCRIGFLKDFEESCITQSSIGINKILDDNRFKRKGFIVAQGFRGVSWCKSKSFTLFPPALRQGRTSEPGVSHREQSCLSWGSWKGRQERGLETTYTLQPTPSMTHFL